MINPDQAGETWDRIKGFITNREANIEHEEKWGTRRMAYPVRKGQYQFLEGNYHLTRFSTERPFNRELETYLKLDDLVLRSMVTTTLPEDELAAQAAAAARAIRQPRPVPAAEGVAPAGTPVAPAAEGAAPAAPTAEETPVAEAPAAEAPATSEAAAPTAEAEAAPAAEVVEPDPVAEATVVEESAAEAPAAEATGTSDEPESAAD
jgi:ribosomal protein S6